ncbi:MAG: response regulator transcription factor [Chloroflexota bacterium]|nr:response regulator transcription factor [Chloroflexota bacterium]
MIRDKQVNARILLVDDDPAVLSSLRRALAIAGYEVLLAETGEAALSIAQASRPDLVVLDVLLPGIDGFTVCERLRSMRSNVPVLILTAKDTVVDRVVGLDRGADDYLVKPFAVDELLARVRALLRRSQAPAEDQLSFGDVVIDTGAHQGFRAGRPLRLTPREYSLLEMFLRHPRQALSREQICQHVWGYAFEGESNFVDVAVKELRKKLEEHEEPRIIQTIRGFGYVLRED